MDNTILFGATSTLNFFLKSSFSWHQVFLVSVSLPTISFGSYFFIFSSFFLCHDKLEELLTPPLYQVPNQQSTLNKLPTEL